MDLITFVIVMLDRNIGKVLSVVHFLEKVLTISFKVKSIFLKIIIDYYSNSF